jgi:hypothetical protein
MKITVLCGGIPCSLVEVYQRFECTYYLHLKDGTADGILTLETMRGPQIPQIAEFIDNTEAIPLTGCEGP